MEGPNSKPGNSLPTETVVIVHSFYERDEVSLVIKDCVTVAEPKGKKTKKVQKIYFV